MTYLFAFAACVAWTGGVPARRIRPRAVSWGWVPPVALAVALLVIVTDRAAVVIAAALAGATVLYAYSRRRAGQALVRRQEAASQFLGHISASLQAGSSLLDATLRATDQLPDTTPTDLRADASLFCHVLRTGDAAGLRTPELSRVEALWRVGVQRGVPIASLVTAAREEIDAALRHRAATAAALAGPKTSAVVLSLLPLAGIGMGAAMGARPLHFLADTNLGGVLLIVGTALVGAGFCTSQHIIERATQ